jgi:hypothetical protein
MVGLLDAEELLLLTQREERKRTKRVRAEE